MLQEFLEVHPSQALVREVFTQAVLSITLVTMPLSLAISKHQDTAVLISRIKYAIYRNFQNFVQFET